MSVRCLFPVLTGVTSATQQDHNHDHHNTTATNNIVELDPSTLHLAAVFASERDISFPFFVAASWAVVLARYAESGHVQFGFAENTCLFKQYMDHMAIDLDQDVSVQRLLDPSYWDRRAPDGRADPELFNTAVVSASTGVNVEIKTVCASIFPKECASII